MSEQTKLDASVSSFGISLVISSILGALLFAVKAADPEFAEWMEATFGHAWLSQGVLSLAVFLLLGLVFGKSKASGKGLAVAVALGVVLSGLILAAAAVGGALFMGESGTPG